MHHGGHKFHEVFQMKQGRYDLQASKISEMMKSSSLDVSPLPCQWTFLWLTRFETSLYNVLGFCLIQNAPTQSLLSVVNGILDESIERKNGEIPQVIFWMLTTTLIIIMYWCLLTKADDDDQRVACLLRKVVQEIERRISTQAEHLRTV